MSVDRCMQVELRQGAQGILIAAALGACALREVDPLAALDALRDRLMRVAFAGAASAMSDDAELQNAFVEVCAQEVDLAINFAKAAVLGVGPMGEARAH